MAVSNPSSNVTNAGSAREPTREPDFDKRAWAAVIQYLRDHEPRWAAMYEHGVPSALNAQRVTVVFPEGSFFGRQAQTPDGSDALRRAARAVLKAQPEIEIRLSLEIPGSSLAQQEAAQVDERKEAIKKKALSSSARTRSAQGIP